MRTPREAKITRWEKLDLGAKLNKIICMNKELHYSLKSFKTTVVLFCLSFVILTAFAGPSTMQGLVLHFKKVPGAEHMADSSGNHNRGASLACVVSNSPSLVSMQQTRQITLAVWIKPESIPTVFPVVLGKGGNEPPGAYGGYELVLNANGDNDLEFESGPYEALTSQANGKWINNHLGEWIHVAFTLDASTGNAQFYINGQATGDTVNDSGNASDINFDVPNNLYIGQQDPAHNVDRASFDGEIREVMIFNRAISAEEVQKIFNSTMPAEAKKKR
jgi:hypothetical protein